MSEKNKSKKSFPQTLGKELSNKAVEIAHGRLTRVGGQATTAGKKMGLDIIKKALTDQ